MACALMFGLPSPQQNSVAIWSPLHGLLEWGGALGEESDLASLLLLLTGCMTLGKFLLPAQFPCLQTNKAEQDTFLPFFLKQIFI